MKVIFSSLSGKSYSAISLRFVSGDFFFFCLEFFAQLFSEEIHYQIRVSLDSEFSVGCLCVVLAALGVNRGSQGSSWWRAASPAVASV